MPHIAWLRETDIESWGELVAQHATPEHASRTDNDDQLAILTHMSSR